MEHLMRLMERNAAFLSTERAAPFRMLNDDPRILHAYLQEHPEGVHVRDADDWSLLYVAIMRRDTSAVRVILNAKADPTAGCPRYTPLAKAVKMGQTDVVHALLERLKADELDARKAGSKPASLYAIRHGNADLLRAILKAGGSPTLVHGGWPLIFHAAAYSVPCLRVLLERDVPPGLYHAGAAPLHHAAIRGNVLACECLLEAGALVAVRYDGKTAAEYARAAHHFDCADWLDAYAARRGQ